MSRDSKLEVGAINLRIPASHGRDYAGLLTELAGLRRAIRVHGETALAIQNFDAETGRGIISKFTEIDVKGDWFDVERFGLAADEDKASINIPDKLRPNYAAFYLDLNVGLHVVAFETYSESKSLSVRAVEKYFRAALLSPKIARRFGRVEADVVKSLVETDRLLSLANIKEVKFVIRRPNPDDIGEDLAAAIEEQLSGQNADEYRETIRTSSSKGGIEPNERSKKLAGIAAENGDLEVTNIENGVPVKHGTDPKPMIEGEKFQPNNINSAERLFKSLALRVYKAIARNRQANA